ncbi:hypothetical protein [Carboxylicivirga sp. RSCT41]|uniref:hypothetical protein n=1 Tax=Carboxylicivirga agarovorans TaxID=3417570 RepID=UPI003D345C66
MEGVFIHMTENAFKPEIYTIYGIHDKSFGHLLSHIYFYIKQHTRTVYDRN